MRGCDRLGSGGGGQFGCHSRGSQRLGSNYAVITAVSPDVTMEAADDSDRVVVIDMTCLASLASGLGRSSNGCNKLRRAWRGDGDDRSESGNRLRSNGGGQLECVGGSRFGRWSGDELGCNGSGELGSASKGSASGGTYRLGSIGDDRVG
jgi:hypothetical protein